MTKTLALLLDSYRELNAKRLFWIVLAVSALVVGAFAAIGIKGDAITVLWWTTPFESNILSYLDPAVLYKSMFTYFGVGFWLAWVANILALVSTAGIFPDFMAGGSIDLYLSKPISRLRLFLTKYTGGLLFVTMQVAVFSSCSFLVLGFRGHSWEPRIFLAIPLVMLVFSYLFSMCVLLGVLTRSTIASLLITLLLWFGIWGVQSAETLLLRQTIRQDFQRMSLDRRIAETQKELDHFGTTRPTTAAVNPNVQKTVSSYIPWFFSNEGSKTGIRDHLKQLKTEREQLTTTVYTAHKFAMAALTVLPKTQGTSDLLTRALLKDDKDARDEPPPPEMSERRPMGRESRAEREFLQKEIVRVDHQRTPTWILGTSIAFEVLIVGIAAWIFCRRDY